MLVNNSVYIYITCVNHPCFRSVCVCVCVVNEEMGVSLTAVEEAFLTEIIKHQRNIISESGYQIVRGLQQLGVPKNSVSRLARQCARIGSVCVAETACVHTLQICCVPLGHADVMCCIYSFMSQ